MYKQVVYLCAIACTAPLVAAPQRAMKVVEQQEAQEQSHREQPAHEETLDSDDFFEQSPQAPDESARMSQWQLYIASALNKTYEVTSQAARTTYDKLYQAVGWIHGKWNNLWEQSDHGDEQ